MNDSWKWMGVAICVALAGLGCDRSPASEASARASAEPLGSAAQSQAATRVTRVVFVGKEKPCQCTKARLDAGWAALQAAIGTPPKVPIERLNADTQPAEIEPYGKQKPMVALPALYFVDASGSVVDLVQGEVTREQIAAALAK